AHSFTPKPRSHRDTQRRARPSVQHTDTAYIASLTRLASPTHRLVAPAKSPLFQSNQRRWRSLPRIRAPIRAPPLQGPSMSPRSVSTSAIQPGSATRLGANWDGEGTNFALFSAYAERVELCLFDET